ncbi:hypothetical protein [uncultured Bacteroides sp.]|uniref:hypothetical protein n=1 Tax=uncultured Bacteroides sp. TaxID=162156 RepID=UPI0026182AD8|nr:hypothetical protein [uncultured Bacteroides sp.]
MIKVYEAIRMNSSRLITSYLGVKVELNFKNGNLLRGVNANLVTSDRFVQDAIENDSRFGVTIRLKSSYPESSDEKESIAKEKEKARRQSRSSSTREQRQAAKEEVNSVEEVKSINDVISYFTSLGETVEDEAQIEELKAKYKVKFPNLK